MTPSFLLWLAAPARRTWRLVWRALLFVIAALLAWTYVDFRELWRGLLGVPPLSLALLFAIVTADRFAMAYKWRFIGRSLDIALPYWECLKAYYGATVLVHLMPTSLGGDLYRGMRLSHGQQKGPVFVTIAMEKVVNAAASLVWAWLGLAWLYSRVPPAAALAILINLGLITAVVAGVYLFLLAPALHDLLLRLLRRMGVHRDLSALEAATTGFSRRKARLAGAVALGVVENLGDYALFFFAGLAIGVNVEPAAFFAAIVLNHVVRKVVLYADSWSLAEAASVAAYGLIGIPPHEALALSVLRHALNFLAAAPGALFFYQRERATLPPK